MIATLSSIEAKFGDAMAAYGLTPPEIVADGQRHRFDGPEDKRGKKSAWYVLYSDGVPAGAYGDWKLGISEKWSGKPDQAMTAAERAEYRAKIEKAKQVAEFDRLEMEAAAAKACTDILAAARDATDDSPYCQSKGIKPYGLKEFKDKRTLIVPIRDGSGKVTSAQFIDQDGAKRFKSHGKIKGCYYSFGGKPVDVLLVCEGFATGASLHAVTGWPVAVAFNAGNLEAVALVLRKKLPDIKIIVCADNDRFNEGGNIGIEKATAAALAVGGYLAVPQFASDEGKPTDFNDLHQTDGGADAVRACIEAAQMAQAEQSEAVRTELVRSEVRTESTPDDGFDATVTRLAVLKPHEYDKERIKEAKRLGIQIKTLDAAIKAARSADDEANDSPFDEVDPWPDPVDPAALLSDITATVQRFIVCEPETAHASALWTAMTWLMDVVQVAPLAVITAPEKRCGKSQLLFLLGRTVCKPLPASNITPAALFRSIDKWRPTLLIDEADAFMKENEELRGLLNCGHTRESAFSIRTVGDDHTPTRFNLWGAKALAGIGHLADTLMDRAVTLVLRRKLPHENVDKLRHAEPDLFENLRRKLARFADDYNEAVRAARPALPDALNDRAQDNWEPLLAIADCAGGVWPELARKAALKLSGEGEQTQSHGAELLADIKEVFEAKRFNKVFTSDLVEALCEDSEKSWSTYNRGKPITPKQLAKKLAGFGVISKSCRIGYDNKKGFEKSQFEDAFARYLSTPPENGISPVTSSQASTGKGLAAPIQIVTDSPVTQIVTRKPSTGAGCDDVTAKNTVFQGSEEKDSESNEVTEDL